ncbi:MAG: hypothetical protein JNJ58_07700 [Chitinophagaceae bacterium]|nr:hypothetical protein [Chitinophagaceae bacterium]
MKKNFTLFLTFFFLIFCLSACNEYKSITSATKVSHLAGNPFMYQLSKSILKNTKNFMADNDIKMSGGKLNLLTPLASVFTQGDQINTYKQMLREEYQVPVKKLDLGFSKLRTMKDLIMFIAKNGRSFDLYKSSSFI